MCIERNKSNCFSVFQQVSGHIAIEYFKELTLPFFLFVNTKKNDNTKAALAS